MPARDGGRLHEWPFAPVAGTDTIVAISQMDYDQQRVVREGFAIKTMIRSLRSTQAASTITSVNGVLSCLRATAAGIASSYVGPWSQ